MTAAHRVDAFRTARPRCARAFLVLVLVLRAATLQAQTLAAVARESAVPPPALPSVRPRSPRFSCSSADRPCSTSPRQSHACRSRARKSPTHWSRRVSRSSCTARPRHHLHVRLGPAPAVSSATKSWYSAIQPPLGADAAAVSRRADCRGRQRQRRGGVGHRVEQVRRRQGGRSRGRLRREEGGRGQPPAAAGGRWRRTR